MMRYVLKKENGRVTQNAYTQKKEGDANFYYVYYSYKTNENGEFFVYTNSRLFGESRVIYKSKNKEEVIVITEKINGAIRLLVGYYDEYIEHKDILFPSTRKNKVK